MLFIDLLYQNDTVEINTFLLYVVSDLLCKRIYSNSVAIKADQADASEPRDKPNRHSHQFFRIKLASLSRARIQPFICVVFLI